MCTIPDAGRALAEMRRVLKENGQLLFAEHGLAPDESVRWWQDRVTPAWRYNQRRMSPEPADPRHD
jgi:ubiquinone/menaquinone biosynthesis C-methylase UbiE